MKSRTVPIAIVAGGIMIALAVYLSIPKQTGGLGGNPSLVRPVDTSDHILGNPAAKVVIVEYSDFDCEFCKGFNDALHQIVANQGTNGNVAWVYRQFPLTELHPNAMKHAEAAECAAIAGGNDAFWKFADILFANQPIDPMKYGVFAKTAGIPGDAFANCYTNAATTVDARISADRKNALDIGAQGTPYSLILVDGKTPIVINGSYPYDVMNEMVTTALKGL
jgi:protein-disulfide isomerase